MSLKPTAVALLALTLSLAAPTVASAAERYVAPDGDDDANACLVEAAPCATIGHAVGQATAGDTVRVAAGTFEIDAMVVVAKDVTIAGAQAGVDGRLRDLPAGQETVLTPGDALSAAALVRLSAPGATVDGVTVRDHDQAGIQMLNSSSGYAVRNSILTGNETGIDLETTADDAQPTTVERNRFESNNAETLRSGIYGDNTADDVTIRDNYFVDHVNVPINISGKSTQQRDLVIEGNRFEDERHLLLLGADGVEVTGNVFIGGRSRAIAVEGDVHDLTIAGNVIGDTANAGIAFTDRYDAGPNTTATIVSNHIGGTKLGTLANATGAAIDVSSQWVGDDPGYEGWLAIHGNRFVGNVGGGVTDEEGQVDIDASDNWWGCNAGPGGDGCDTVGDGIDVPTHLVLRASAAPDTVFPGGQSTVTATLNLNDVGAEVAHTPDETPVDLASALGSFDNPFPSLANGAASSQFTAGPELGGAGATATVDNQTVPIALTVVAAPPIEPPVVEPPIADPPVVDPPVVDPPVVDPPAPAPAPAVQEAKGQPAVGASGQATVAVLTCGAESACRVATPKKLKVKIGGRTYTVKVIAPKRVGPGKRAQVKIKLPKAAREALAKQRNARVKVKLTVSADGRKATRTVDVRIKAKSRTKR